MIKEILGWYSGIVSVAEFITVRFQAEARRTRLTNSVSVAEFITVRFQLGLGLSGLGRVVSVAEFITVRFQRLRFHCEINDVVAWEVDLLSKLMELQKFGSSCIVVGKKIKQLHWKAVV